MAIHTGWFSVGCIAMISVENTWNLAARIIIEIRKKINPSRFYNFQQKLCRFLCAWKWAVKTDVLFQKQGHVSRTFSYPFSQAITAAVTKVKTYSISSNHNNSSIPPQNLSLYSIMSSLAIGCPLRVKLPEFRSRTRSLKIPPDENAIEQCISECIDSTPGHSFLYYWMNPKDQWWV